MSGSRRTCMFCGGSAAGQRRAKEHIFPQHLIRNLPVLQSVFRHSPFRTVEGDFSGGQVTAAPAERELSHKRFTAGTVCKSCNNGWMSGLEGEVVPFIYSLVNGARQLSSLSPDERSSLGIWSLKTAIVLSNSVGSPLFKTPPEHAADLFRSQPMELPDGVAVFGHIGATHRALWSLCPTWVVESRSGAGPSSFQDDYQAAYKIYIQLGNLMLLVSWWPSDDFIFTKESWISETIDTSVVVEPRDVDCRTYFADEGEAFMIGVGVSLP